MLHNKVDLNRLRSRFFRSPFFIGADICESPNLGDTSVGDLYLLLDTGVEKSPDEYTPQRQFGRM